MTLVDRTMQAYKRLRDAMRTKSTHFEVDERVDMAIKRNTEANNRSQRVMMSFNQTLENLKVEHRVRSR